MTAERRLERDLPNILGDLSAGPYPDYIDDVLTITAQRRQRPAWTFPERWLPVAEITSRSAVAPRVPWRTVALAMLLIALIAVGAAAYIGSHQTRLPAPFGPAANGLIALQEGGDLLTVDPSTGEHHLLVGGPSNDEWDRLHPRRDQGDVHPLVGRRRGR